MKRSKTLALGLMATSAIALTACSDDQIESKSYRDVDSCIADAVYTKDQCEGSYQTAKTFDELSGPRYDTRATCEGEFGTSRCTERSSGGVSYWSPFLQGYLISSLVNKATGGPELHSRPYYSPRRGGYYTAYGTRVNFDSRGASVPRESMTATSKPAKVQTRTSVLSRGGFGSRSGSRSSSSWGG